MRSKLLILVAAHRPRRCRRVRRRASTSAPRGGGSSGESQPIEVLVAKKDIARGTAAEGPDGRESG